LSALAAQALGELRDAADQQGTELVLLPRASVVVSADRAAMLEAIKAVVKNGLEAVDEGGSVTVEVTSDTDQAVISIIDDGPGIPAEIRPHLFDPYFSGREAGRGLGLGLSKCWRILDEHGGRVEVASEPLGGACFRLVLPISASDRMGSPPGGPL
jgi:signal transduction histidine kinase